MQTQTFYLPSGETLIVRAADFTSVDESGAYVVCCRVVSCQQLMPTTIEQQKELMKDALLALEQDDLTLLHVFHEFCKVCWGKVLQVDPERDPHGWFWLLNGKTVDEHIQEAASVAQHPPEQRLAKLTQEALEEAIGLRKHLDRDMDQGLSELAD